MTNEDLIPITLDKIAQPRTNLTCGIPGLINIMQNEWDALMLEIYTLREHLANVRMELSQTLYQHEAACRVIARLLKERDDAKSQLASALEQIAQAKSVKPIEKQEIVQEKSTEKEMKKEELKEEKGMHSVLLQRLNDTFAKMSSERKKRRISKTIANAKTIGTYKVIKDFKVHENAITNLELGDNILSSSLDGTAKLFSIEKDEIVSVFKYHSKAVKSAVYYQNDKVILCSSDKTASIWKICDDKPLHILPFKSSVNSCVVHPTGEYGIFGEKESLWSMINLDTAQQLFSVPLQEEAKLRYKYHIVA